MGVQVFPGAPFKQNNKSELILSNTPNGTDIIEFDGVSFMHKEIYSVVDQFYKKISKDDLLSVPFSSVGDWPYHIERMTNFWWMKFGGTPYMFSKYSPIPKHFHSGFNNEFLKRWLQLFEETLNEVGLVPEQIKVWRAMSHRIGEHLTKRNEIYGDEYNRKLNL